MTRLRADLCLLLVAIIWGAAFVAQKSGMEGGIGPYSFVWLRFLLSLFVIFPFVWREHKANPIFDPKILFCALPVVVAFVAALLLQQIGMQHTSVTNAGFITGLYVVFTPFFAWALFKYAPSRLIWPAIALSMAGMWFINGGSFAALTIGDFWILLCAVSFGAHVALTGWFLSKYNRPLLLVMLQYGASVMAGLFGALMFETLTWDAVTQNWFAIFYAGVISGGVAYTLQAVAQQYTPPSNAAIILSSEAVFAAIAGVVLLSEAVTFDKVAGCAFILLAILCVEGRAFLSKSKI